MAEYIDRNLIEWHGCNFENASCENRECSGCSHAECSHSQVMQIPTADVIERSEYDKMVQAFRDRNENLKQNLINTRDNYFKLEKEYTELKVNIDKAIEELRKEIKENRLNVIDYADGEWIVKGFVYGAIERFKRNIGE